MTAPFKPLTKDDIAEVLGVSLRTIENWVNDGTLRAPKKVGNRVYWHPNTFYTWLEEVLTSDAPAVTELGVGEVVPGSGKTKPKKPAKAGRTELDALHFREQAKLDALLA
jgi:excisionase family DNA binding protein